MHERIIGLYEDHGAAWDAQRGRELIEKPWLDRLAALLAPGGTVLDLGCGMGEPIARYLIALGFRVTGYDSASSLIALCRERFPDHEWIVGDMRALQLGRTFDGIIVWHSSFHLIQEDQRALFPRLAAHVAPGGYLMFTSGHSEGVSIGEWMGEPLYHASLSQEEYRSLLDSCGFDLVETRVQDPGCGDATVTIARRRAQPQEPPRFSREDSGSSGL